MSEVGLFHLGNSSVIKCLLFTAGAWLSVVGAACEAWGQSRREAVVPTSIEQKQEDSKALAFRAIEKIDLAISPVAELTPESVNQRESQSAARPGSLREIDRAKGKSKTWESPGLVQNPLYFEDVALERYGLQSPALIQVPKSGLTFVGHTLLLPYRILQEPPARLNYTLGYQRPGDCVHRVKEHPFASIRQPSLRLLQSHRHK